MAIQPVTYRPIPAIKPVSRRPEEERQKGDQRKRPPNGRTPDKGEGEHIDTWA